MDCKEADYNFLANLTSILLELGRELNQGKVRDLKWLNVSIGWVSCGCCQSVEPSVAQIIGTRNDGSEEWLQTVLEDALEPYEQHIGDLVRSLSPEYRKVALSIQFEVCLVQTI